MSLPPLPYDMSSVTFISLYFDLTPSIFVLPYIFFLTDNYNSNKKLNMT